jgi:UDP-glucose 4-epimerase
MKVFVTGGMGFIGSYIVMELLSKGHEVTILARNPAKVPAFQTMPGIAVVQGGLDDFDLIAKSLPGHDACVHNALYWGNTATDMLKNDTRCSVHIFEIAANAGVKDMVYTSSTAAMGDFRPDMNEEMKPKPADFYGATKEATEAYLLAFGKRTEMRCNIVRPGYTIGNPVVPGAHIYSDPRFKNIIKAALAGEDIRLTKDDGTQFIWAGDLAKIYSAILEAKVNREIYFGLGETWTPWAEVALYVIELTGSKSQIALEDKGYSHDPIKVDLGKIKREFGLDFRSTDRLWDHVRWLVESMR